MPKKSAIVATVAGISLTASELTVLRLLPPQGEQATTKALVTRAKERLTKELSYPTVYKTMRDLKKKGAVTRRGKRVIISGLPSWRVFWETLVPLTWSDPHEPLP